MMCDVMPTISEDGGPGTDRDSNYSGDESNFEQLMVNMLDERDRLMETLRESQETLAVTQAKLQEAERDRDAFQKQLSATQPQVAEAAVWLLYAINVCFCSLFCIMSVMLYMSCCRPAVLTNCFVFSMAFFYDCFYFLSIKWYHTAMLFHINTVMCLPCRVTAAKLLFVTSLCVTMFIFWQHYWNISDVITKLSGQMGSRCRITSLKSPNGSTLQ